MGLLKEVQKTQIPVINDRSIQTPLILHLSFIYFEISKAINYYGTLFRQDLTCKSYPDRCFNATIKPDHKTPTHIGIIHHFLYANPLFHHCSRTRISIYRAPVFCKHTSLALCYPWQPDQNQPMSIIQTREHNTRRRD